MTHPTREDWMSYLYDELSPERRSEMSAHLGACAACATQVKTWRGAADSLDAFELPSRPSRGRAPAAVKWAIAAGLVVFAGLAAVRVAALQREVNHMRADMHGAIRRQVETSVREELATRMRADLDAALADLRGQASREATAEAQALVASFAQRLEAERVATQQATLAALQKLGARHTQDYAALRKELETVAVLTEAGLQRAQNQIATLAFEPGGEPTKN